MRAWLFWLNDGNGHALRASADEPGPGPNEMTIGGLSAASPT